MLKLILSRVLQGIVVLVVVSALTFALLAAAGGDALGELSTAERATSEATMRQMRRVYGLDEPLAVRYARWLWGLVRGQMGESFYYHAPVATIIWPRLLRTLALAAVALTLALSVSLTLGALAARRRGSAWDRASELIILLTASTPRIVLALATLAIVARTSWFTVGGADSGGEVLADLRPLRILPPAFVLAIPLVALFLAQAREGLSDALGQDFVRVARAKGLSERTVIMRHALREALNPLITLFGYSFGSVVSGSVIVESVLGWSGLGLLSVNAVRHRDVPLLMGIVMITATAVLVGNLIADILLRLNDPRLRHASNARTTRQSGRRPLSLPASGA